MNNYLILYNKEDLDSAVSAALIDYHIRCSDGSSNVEHHHCSDNIEKNITEDNIRDWSERYKKVIMTGISFRDYLMMFMRDTIKDRLLWIDHHHDAIDASRTIGYDDIDGERDWRRTSTLLAFKHFFDCFDVKYNDSDVPPLFNRLSDCYVYAGMRYDTNLDYDKIYDAVVEMMDAWIDYTDNLNDSLIDALDNITTMATLVDKYEKYGKLIVDYEDRKAAHLIDDYGDCTWTVDGRSACALFTQDRIDADVFKSLKGHDNIKVGIVFKRNQDGTWKMSLFNITDKSFECRKYLNHFYSGGVLTETQFTDILRKRTI